MKRKLWITWILIVVGIIMVGCSGTEPMGVDAYLAQSSWKAKIGQVEESFWSQVIKDAENAEVVFIGEVHGDVSRLDLMYSLATTLNKELGYSNILLEGPYSVSLYINQYLETGEEKYLESVFECLRGTLWHTEEDFAYFQQIREYNQTAKTPLRFVGIDFERTPTLNFAYIGEMLQKHHVSLNAYEAFMECTKRECSQEEAEEKLAKLVEELQRQEVRKALAEDDGDVQILAQNINMLVGKDILDIHDYEFRDGLMYANFKAVKERFEGKWVGSFGNDHTPLKNGKWITIAEQLQTDAKSPVKGKVLSIRWESETQVRNKSENEKETKEKITQLLDNGYHLIKLDGNRTPFQGENSLKFYDLKEDGIKRTSEYAQYILFIQGDTREFTPYGNGKIE